MTVKGKKQNKKNNTKAPHEQKKTPSSESYWSRRVECAFIVVLLSREVVLDYDGPSKC